jgi:DNA-binding MarR family transcriptional regulator
VTSVKIGLASVSDLSARLNAVRELLLDVTKQFGELEAAFGEALSQGYKTEKGNLTPDGRRRLAELLARGYKKSHIAEELGITPPAVTRHCQKIEELPRSFS